MSPICFRFDIPQIFSVARLKVENKKAVMEERMPGGKIKTVVYPFDEAINYTNEGENMMRLQKNLVNH